MTTIASIGVSGSWRVPTTTALLKIVKDAPARDSYLTATI
jgi:hypothetical protein